jgi:hypothetical protein
MPRYRPAKAVCSATDAPASWRAAPIEEGGSHAAHTRSTAN